MKVVCTGLSLPTSMPTLLCVGWARWHNGTSVLTWLAPAYGCEVLNPVGSALGGSWLLAWAREE